MAISVTDLPPKYQAQVIGKYIEQQKRRETIQFSVQAQGQKKKTKYHNIPTEREIEGGVVIRFDSKKEANRYDQLISLARTGKIKDLRLQADFTLQEAYTDAAGCRVRAIRYKADFTYLNQDNALVVEDVKSQGTRTKEYVIKRKMLQERFGIKISEV